TATSRLMRTPRPMKTSLRVSALAEPSARRPQDRSATESDGPVSEHRLRSEHRGNAAEIGNVPRFTDRKRCVRLCPRVRMEGYESPRPCIGRCVSLWAAQPSGRGPLTEDK